MIPSPGLKGTQTDCELGSLPLALRALVKSGVLAALKANLAMPVLSVAIARWLDVSSSSRRRESPTGLSATAAGPM
jgi:antibiotic biosynthesis monooxygenase (ABM) superfamily enzyme